MNQKQPLSILLIEDEEDACEIIGSMLSMAYPNANIYTATNGKTGLGIFGTHKPLIVITDINMPEMNGDQLLQEISKINPDTRFIVITAHSDRQNLDKISSTGIAAELIPKPVDFMALVTSINRSIAA
jgi:YesN/AraC family two-component response regulator